LNRYNSTPQPINPSIFKKIFRFAFKKMNKSLSLVCIFAIQIVFVQFAFSQKEPGNQSVLLIDEIMKGEQFTGYSPQNISWHPNSRQISFSWNPEMEIIRNTYGVDISTADSIFLLSNSERMSLPSGGNWDKELKRYVYSNQGDIYIFHLEQEETIQLTHTHAHKSSPTFSTCGSKIIFRQANDLYTMDPSNGRLNQLIRFERGNEPKEPQLKPNEEWLRNDQLELFDILRHRKAQKELREERNEEGKKSGIYTIYTGTQTVSNQQLCPNGRFITFTLSQSADPTNTDVPNYVTESGQLKNLRSRPKVGHPQTEYSFWIFDMERDTHYQVSTAQIPEIRKKPAFFRDYHSSDNEYEEYFEEDRKVVILGPHYAEDGKAVVIIRSMDNKDRWIMQLKPENAELILLDHQRDEAWIGGPGIVGWNFSSGNVGWLKDIKHFYFQSEKTAFSHLYTVNVETKEITALTAGNWEVLDVSLSHEGEKFFITANAEGPHEHHFYHLPVEGGDLEKITSRKGGHEIFLSPDQQYLAFRYSNSNTPWELFLMKNEKKAPISQITRSTTEEFNAYAWRNPEIIWFEARDGIEVPARIYRPAPENHNGAAVIFVHGAGYLQNVHHWWSTYYREFMFHNILADNGYTVLDIDFRASAGYGRDWRTAIYRHMGGKDLTDQVDGAKWLMENENIEEGKIGIYGGSYGGFITIMAMFLEPETFAAGAALRSVTDWAHYNHGYTSNILNTPVEDSMAFKRSSPIYHAEGLEGALLMLHGIIDINVQYQDVVRLSQKLIELRKEHWDLAIYPLEDHGFIEHSSWSDEYRRIFYWFEKYLFQNH